MSSSAPGSPQQQAVVVLIIRDGWGFNPDPNHDAFNAVKLAKTPVDDALRERWPHTLIATSGEAVGLPAGTMGNSEVGHQNIGAGRIVDQELMRITRAIRDGVFFENASILAAIEHAHSRNSNVHIMGLLSDGQVHSDIEHVRALLQMLQQRGFPHERVFVHAFTDGRDTGPYTGKAFIDQLELMLQETGGRIATVVGRYFAMDRDHRWERTQAAYSALTGRGQPQLSAHAHSAAEAVERAYASPADPSRQGDEFIPPAVLFDDASIPLPRIDDGDAVLFFNFRGDRPRQLVRAFTLDDSAWNDVPQGGFDRGRRIDDLFFVGMTGYERGLPMNAVIFEKPPPMPNILGEMLAAAGKTQFRCAETEKFAHVTFFFNDYREEPFKGEHRLLCPSPKDVATYDMRPQMSAAAVRDGVLARLGAPDCEALLVVNFANPDMVGHTGSLAAAIVAVETVDACVGSIVNAAQKRKASVIITADHGNAEQMFDTVNNCPHTSHTTNDVPLILIDGNGESRRLRAGGRLADIAPTILTLLGLQQPQAMSGQSLFEEQPLANDKKTSAN
ncbi:MAG: 2,3-bisphosphoglycerate-independent phosphoglycerate mutase [Phycisphaerales bacterium]